MHCFNFLRNHVKVWTVCEPLCTPRWFQKGLDYVKIISIQFLRNISLFFVKLSFRLSFRLPLKFSLDATSPELLPRFTSPLYIVWIRGLECPVCLGFTTIFRSLTCALLKDTFPGSTQITKSLGKHSVDLEAVFGSARSTWESIPPLRKEMARYAFALSVDQQSASSIH